MKVLSSESNYTVIFQSLTTRHRHFKAHIIRYSLHYSKIFTWLIATHMKRIRNKIANMVEKRTACWLTGSGIIRRPVWQSIITHKMPSCNSKCREKTQIDLSVFTIELWALSLLVEKHSWAGLEDNKHCCRDGCTVISNNVCTLKNTDWKRPRPPICQSSVQVATDADTHTMIGLWIVHGIPYVSISSWNWKGGSLSFSCLSWKTLAPVCFLPWPTK